MGEGGRGQLPGLHRCTRDTFQPPPQTPGKMRARAPADRGQGARGGAGWGGSAERGSEGETKRNTQRGFVQRRREVGTTALTELLKEAASSKAKPHSGLSHLPVCVIEGKHLEP